MKSVLDRVDPTFRKELNEICMKKWEKENKRISFRRMTKAMRNLSYWNTIKEDLLNAEIKDDRLDE